MAVNKEASETQESPHDGLLRQEIIESQKTQADFLKWKLIAVASVASLSFGFASEKPTSESAKFLLCLVPLLCGYVDLISLHVMIRIFAIGTYLRCSGNRYESFIASTRGKAGANPFVFEAGALHGSSFIFNSSMLALAWVLNREHVGWPSICLKAYVVSGSIGILWTLILLALYLCRVRAIQQVAQPKLIQRS